MTCWTDSSAPMRFPWLTTRFRPSRDGRGLPCFGLTSAPSRTPLQASNGNSCSTQPLHRNRGGMGIRRTRRKTPFFLLHKSVPPSECWMPVLLLCNGTMGLKSRTLASCSRTIRDVPFHSPCFGSFWKAEAILFRRTHLLSPVFSNGVPKSDRPPAGRKTVAAGGIGWMFSSQGKTEWILGCGMRSSLRRMPIGGLDALPN